MENRYRTVVRCIAPHIHSPSLFSASTFPNAFVQGISAGSPTPSWGKMQTGSEFVPVSLPQQQTASEISPYIPSSAGSQKRRFFCQLQQVGTQPLLCAAFQKLLPSRLGQRGQLICFRYGPEPCLTPDQPFISTGLLSRSRGFTPGITPYLKLLPEIGNNSTVERKFQKKKTQLENKQNKNYKSFHSIELGRYFEK